MTEHWYRLSIDVDRAGQPVGLSYEVRTAKDVHRVHVLAPPGPFDSVVEALCSLMDDLTQRYGIQTRLI